MFAYPFLKFAAAFVLVLSLQAAVSTGSWAQNVPYLGERIVVVADGNEHGKGDWAATPLSLAVLAAKEVQDQVMVYAFSSHTWGSNKNHPGDPNQ